MSKKDQNVVEIIAKSLKYVQEIFELKKGYYFYFNYPNSKTKALKIHKYNCGNCNYGTGKIKGMPGKNGVWIGPFSKIEQAEIFINNFMTDYSSKIDFNCNCIN